MKIKFISTSYLGKISGILVLLVPILFSIGMLVSDYYSPTPAGNTILEDLTARPLVSISMLSGFLSGILAFFCGIAGIIKKKDYSILTIISTILGLLILIWIVLEIISPH